MLVVLISWARAANFQLLLGFLGKTTLCVLNRLSLLRQTKWSVARATTTTTTTTAAAHWAQLSFG